MHQWYRGFVQGKTRVAAAWIFSILLVLTSRNYPEWAGVLVCFLGASLRFWASGYIRKDSRPAVGGPYRWVRNPLYLGTYLMAVGAVWCTGNYWMLGVSSVLFATIYHYIILDEEEKLERIFGAQYLEWKSKVARFFPRPWPASTAFLSQINADGAYQRFDWKLAVQNKAFEAYYSFLGLVGFLTASAAVWKMILNH